jgi:signal transduction histidine kinase
MVNLISNAVKFCAPDTGEITIKMQGRPASSGSSQRAYLLVCVQDNGIGIAREDQEIVFQEFRQVMSGARGRPAGTGVGLTITRHIIDSHGGKIWVESELKKGASFFFKLPLVE